MNPQIRLLAEQAGYVDKGSNITAYINFNHEKFAQLIIQECIDICLRNATAKDLDRWSAGVCAFDIQEHFGVD